MKKIVLLLILIVGVVLMGTWKNQNHKIYHYIITETGKYSSLDPLDGDQTQNLPVQRMVYATPVEVDHSGQLTSSVLSHFSYDQEKNKVKWILKDGVKYSDGTLITAEDVAFAVARMALKRPKFPVIEYIDGLQEWIKRENALESFPTGIKVTGNQIEIQFSQTVKHPLFRFSLEIFSVIPKKMVDLKINTVTQKIPSSGHYEIVKEDDKNISFKLRENSLISGYAPAQIEFSYKLPKEVFNEGFKLNPHSVIQGNEIKLSLNEHSKLTHQFKTMFMPAARIALNLLNPQVGVFKDKNCRLVFAESYRKAFSEITKGDFKIESSIFTEVITGYKTSMALQESVYSKLSQTEIENCIQKIKQNPPKWAQTEDASDEFFRTVAKKTLESLGVKDPQFLKLKDRKEEVEAFINGDISIMGASTGFWALDPSGDVQMLLTPNMHKLLRFVSNDDQLQSLIKKMNNDPETFKSLNQYIFNEAKMNIFAHVRRFYSSDDINNMSELPLSITSPAPWQVFKK